MSTRRERLENAIARWELGGFEAPAPHVNHYGFVSAAMAAGALPEGNARSYTEVLRLMHPHTTPEVPEEPEAFPNTLRRYRRRYALSEGDDGERHYIFYSKEPFSIPERAIESMKRAYANKPAGLGWTINKVCTHFGIGRAEFQFVRVELGWTHDQDEFTREEHLELNTEQLLEDREQRSRWLLEQEVKRREVTEAFEKAKRWDDAIGRYLADDLPTLEVPPPGSGVRSFAVVPLADIHIEDAADAGTKIAKIHAAMLRARNAGASRAVLVFLGDWFNYDTYGRTTTRGTLVGSEDPETMVRTAYAAARYVVEYAKRIFEGVDVVVVAGNHDRMQTIGFSIWLEGILGHAPTVQSARNGLELAEVRFGQNVCWFEHGDGGRGKLENIIMKATATFGRDATKRYHLYTGHLHHAKMLDVSGVLCHQLPAPKNAKRNDWEEKAGYASQHGIRADVYSRDSLKEIIWEWM